MTSTLCSVPSAVTIPSDVTRAILSVMSVVFGLATASIVVGRVQDSLTAGPIARCQPAAQLAVFARCAGCSTCRAASPHAAGRAVWSSRSRVPPGPSRCRLRTRQPQTGHVGERALEASGNGSLVRGTTQGGVRWYSCSSRDVVDDRRARSGSRWRRCRSRPPVCRSGRRCGPIPRNGMRRPANSSLALEVGDQRDVQRARRPR